MKKIILATGSILLLAVVAIAATKTDNKAAAPAPAPTAAGASRPATPAASAPVAAAPAKPTVKPADEWKERGKKGAARVAALASGKKAGSLKAEENCEYIIESAYAAFNDPKTLEKVKRVGGGVETYTLLIQAKDQSYSQISFFYSQTLTQLVAVTAFQLSKGWNFTVSASTPITSTLEGEGCRYAFDFKSPVSPKVSAVK